ncbi:gliding motility protein GldN [Spongiivirga sp. MCCC 1A20706]|uniref:type IX secretion system ring protein PorN/GldN n=1 Tax=Spongiivirga sp. MCCC 1A20706 TaxID=3160963 RepID=UPI003977BDFF
MKRIFVAIMVTAGFSYTAVAQSNLLNAKTPEMVGVKTEQQIEADNDQPLEYGYVDDRDILWSKTVWEVIDLDERINFPLYYPIDTVNIGSDRRSLYQIFMRELNSGRLEVYADSYFTEKRTTADIESALVKKDTLDAGFDQLNAGETLSAEYVDIRELSGADIEAFHVKGVWYFDKRQGEMKYRLLGIAPVAPDVQTIDDDEPDMIELFWVWFPSIRPALHEAKVFNKNNTAMPLSYDHLLNSRRFNATIYKEDNEYGDRRVNEYVRENALMQLLESERIKERIRDFEQDMWSY